MSRADMIPQELVEKIVANLRNHLDLRSAALVSRIWTHASQSMLFRQIHIYTPQSLITLAHAIANTPHLAIFPRRLILVLSSSMYWHAAFSRIADKLPKLESLEISMGSLRTIDDALRRSIVLGFPHIASLMLEESNCLLDIWVTLDIAFGFKHLTMLSMTPSPTPLIDYRLLQGWIWPTMPPIKTLSLDTRTHWPLFQTLLEHYPNMELQELVLGGSAEFGQTHALLREYVAHFLSATTPDCDTLEITWSWSRAGTLHVYDSRIRPICDQQSYVTLRIPNLSGPDREQWFQRVVAAALPHAAVDRILNQFLEEDESVWEILDGILLHPDMSTLTTMHVILPRSFMRWTDGDESRLISMTMERLRRARDETSYTVTLNRMLSTPRAIF